MLSCVPFVRSQNAEVVEGSKPTFQSHVQLGPVQDARNVVDRVRHGSDSNANCERLGGPGEQAAALIRVCEAALSMRKTLPDVLCDREMKRYWTQYAISGSDLGQQSIDETAHSDVVTAKVHYMNGKESYEDVRIDGQAIEATAPQSSGTWSDGEFATILEGIFLQSTKADFHFQKEAKLRSARVLIFGFRVAAENNKSYLLHAEEKGWFPEYGGRLWIDKQSFRLLRLERETVDMPSSPITRMKTKIDYSDLSLGDGSMMVLPVHSDVLICMPAVRGNSDNCARNSIKFTNWHKFRATTKIVLNPAR